MKKEHHKKHTSFCHFLEEPHIAAALIVFALITLALSLIEFGKIMSYYPY